MSSMENDNTPQLQNSDSELDAVEAEKRVQELMGPAAQSAEPEETVVLTPAEQPVAETVADVPDSPTKTDVVVDDSPHDAIDNIMKSDSHDDPAAGDLPAVAPVVMKETFFGKVKARYLQWWDNKLARYGTLAAGVALIAAVVFLAPLRNGLLNLFGVRTSVSVIAYDDSTKLPLKNAVLSASGNEVKTDANGKAKLYGVKLGKQDVRLQKAGFAAYTKTIDFEMRTIALGDVYLKAQGAQYGFVVIDYFSAKPVSDVVVTSGEATTKSDSKGFALLTVPPVDGDTFTVTLEKKGFRTEKVTLAVTAKDRQAVTFVPAQKEVFLSKESGKYTVYKMDLDAKNKKVLLEGTGLETNMLSLLVNTKGDRAALVSTRDEKRNKDGYLLSALTIIDVETGESETIEHAEDITMLGWKGSTLVYRMTVAGASAANNARQKIMSYDYSSSRRNQIANANYFTGATLQADKAYYVVSSTDPAVEGNFARTNLDGTAKKILQQGTLWGMYRVDYKTIKLQSSDKWYTYTFENDKVSESTPPVAYTTRKYLDSEDTKRSAWVDIRDASGVLMVYDVATGKDKEVTKQRGLQEVTRWVNGDVLIYRVSVNGGVEEYAVSVSGGEPKKLADVSILYQ